jgi:predicted DCC family thiol-disulfide oxidoreductase YuxK
VPSPRNRPLVVYHGGCAFCRRWVARLRRWDRAGRLEFLPLQDERAPALTGVRRETLEHAAHVVLPSGAVLAGAEAFRALCAYLPGGTVPGLLLRIPGALPAADRVYRWVARRWGPVGDRPRDR